MPATKNKRSSRIKTKPVPDAPVQSEELTPAMIKVLIDTCLLSIGKFSKNVQTSNLLYFTSNSYYVKDQFGFRIRSIFELREKKIQIQIATIEEKIQSLNDSYSVDEEGLITQVETLKSNYNHAKSLFTSFKANFKKPNLNATKSPVNTVTEVEDEKKCVTYRLRP